MEKMTILGARIPESLMQEFNNYCDKIKSIKGIKKEYLIQNAIKEFMENNPVDKFK